MNENTDPWIKWLILGLFIFNILVLITGAFIWESALDKNVLRGDELARIGYIPLDSKVTPSQNITLTRINWLDYLEEPEKYDIDLLIVGDSFSNSGNLPEYLASQNNIQVLAIRTLEVQPLRSYTPINLLIALDNGGIIDMIDPQCIILETVPRYLYDTTNAVNFNAKITKTELKSALTKFYKNEEKNTTTKIPQDSKEESSGFNSLQTSITNGNFYKTIVDFKDPLGIYLDSVSEDLIKIRQVILSAIWLEITGHTSPIEGQPYTTSRLILDKPLFTSERDSNILYFVSDDLLYLEHLDEIGWLYKYSLYLNVIADKFAKRDITFYYMTAVNKFDFYYPEITNNPYPVNPVYEALESTDNAYYYINPKTILNKKLNDEDKDLYFLGNTHWSWISVEYLSSQISLLNSKPKKYSYNDSINKLPENAEILTSYAEGLTNAGEYSYADILSKKIIELKTGRSVSEINLTKSEINSEFGYFDSFSVTGEKIEASGWAIDPILQKPANFIIITDNQQNILVTSPVAIRRPDVSKYTTNTNLLYSGWKTTIDSKNLNENSLPLHAYVILPDMSSAVVLPAKNNVRNLMKNPPLNLSKK